MRSLLFVSLCLLLACGSCAPSITRGLRKGPVQSVRKEQLPPMAQTNGTLLKYNMIFDFMKKHFSGMLLVKQTDTNTIRTLFSTHFGLSLFDFEINKDTLIVHHCIEPLQKKNVLSLLQKDLSILFGLNLQAQHEATVYSDSRKDTEIVYRLDNPDIFYRKNLASGNLEQIKTGRGFGKTYFRLLPGENGNGNSILIRHPLLRLSIQLEPLE